MISETWKLFGFWTTVVVWGGLLLAIVLPIVARRLSLVLSNVRTRPIGAVLCLLLLGFVVAYGGSKSPPVDPIDPTNPDTPVIPVDPDVPSDPEDPSTPEVPSEPGNPTDPSAPSDPEAPSNPEGPSEPDNPTDPSTPSDPEDPSNPEGPSEPGDSVTPDPVNPCYEVIEPDDITEPYAAPKAVTLQGAAYDGCDLVGLVELKLGKVNARKKTSKVSGSVTTLDGKKHTVKSVTVADIDGVSLVAVSLDVKDLGKMDVVIGGMQFAGTLGGKYHVQSAAVGGAWNGGTAKVTVEIEGKDIDLFPGTLLTSLLPDEETATVKNSKWTFNKAASVKWAKPKKGTPLPDIHDEASGKGLIIDDSKGKTNLSGLKLTYTVKKGTFKGSFKVYALEGASPKQKLKKYTINVNGFVLDGIGYGKATCKKPAISWSVTVR